MKRIKILFLVVLTVLTACFATACSWFSGFGGTQEQEQAEITLNLQVADITVGGRVTLKATVVGSSQEVVWTSSDESVATVNHGIVYGVSSGTATITAAIGKSKQTCTVNVSGSSSGGNGLQEIPVLHFNLSAEEIWVGYAFIPFAQLKLSGKAVTTEISFSSSDTSIAKIENGQIVGVSVGTATITATCQYGGELYQKSVAIKVVADNES